jgi:hypothetical protein
MMTLTWGMAVFKRPGFTTEAQSTRRFLISNFPVLPVLPASAVKSPNRF